MDAAALKLPDFLKGKPDDGVYKARMGNKGERLLQVRGTCNGEFRRFTDQDGDAWIIFMRV